MYVLVTWVDGHPAIDIGDVSYVGKKRSKRITGRRSKRVIAEKYWRRNVSAAIAWEARFTMYRVWHRQFPTGFCEPGEADILTTHEAVRRICRLKRLASKCFEHGIK